MSEPFVAEGELWLYSQEGGFAAEGWELNGDELAELVAEHFGAERRKMPKSKQARIDMGYDALRALRSGDIPLGRVRITIEQLEEPES